MPYGETLPILDITERADLVEPAGLVVLRGMHLALKPQLVDRSKEPNILAQTPKDQSRFASVTHIDEREASGTEFYPLTELAPAQEKDILAGLMWLHESDNYPSYGGYTLAIRVYEGFEGRGLAASLMSTVLSEHRRLRPQEHSIWLSVSKNNARAQRLYDRFGFITVASTDDRHIMSAEL